MNCSNTANTQVVIVRGVQLAQPDVASSLSSQRGCLLEFNAIAVGANVAARLEQEIVVAAVGQDFGVSAIDCAGADVLPRKQLDSARE